MSPLQRRVVAELRKHADAAGRSLATYEELAAPLGVTSDQVRRAIEGLHAVGYFHPYEPSIAPAQFFGRLPAG